MIDTESIMTNRYVAKFVDFSIKLGQQRHLAAIKDSFFLMMPLSMLAGFVILINNVVFVEIHKLIPTIFDANALTLAQQWGTAINNGALLIGSLLIAPLTAYTLSRNDHYISPISAAIVGLASFVMLLPLNNTVLGSDGQEITLSGVILFDTLGPKSLFGAIIIGLVSAEIFMKLNKMNIKITMPEGVPSGVAHSFEVMIPTMITTVFLATISFILILVTKYDLLSLINVMIQTPLRAVNGSLPGFLFLFSLGGLLFAFGIHQTVINSTLTDPFLGLNFGENMINYQANLPVEHILTSAFKDHYLMMGGTGSTLALLVAVFIFSRQVKSRQLAKLSLPASLFNINEPIIFGFPIIFNLPMIIPFVLVPIVNALIAYPVIEMGWVNKAVISIPWTIPPLFNSFMATLDWRAPILQLVLLLIDIIIYLPFLKINEAVDTRIAAQERENQNNIKKNREG